MSLANGSCVAARTDASAVLMARVVDGTGVAVRSADVEAVRYSIRQLDLERPADDLPLALGRDGIVLDVRDVFFDSLQTGGLWTTDDVGYNFRHEIGLHGSGIVGKAAGAFLVYYELRPVCGETTILRFQIR